ncbi:hypothetical protein PF006_g27108 [Phytophthora fragariae]|uniref:Uncharacterized protein n=1 Tax=Phytophthora fragariae TaxID=53985 RepID=A0A6A3QS54_9STRA|nr:hypothetical protein PF003_g30886 [Phytophthora fragariae]KAE9081456.1 hypothetical protein PF006_g27108 [Phytophthora fragariae]
MPASARPGRIWLSARVKLTTTLFVFCRPSPAPWRRLRPPRRRRRSCRRRHEEVGAQARTRSALFATTR